jgi:hypothetical protein
MSSANGRREASAREDLERPTRWEGYSDYQRVSGQIARSVDDALDAYAQLDSAHMEGAQISPEFASEVRARILSAAMKLVPELENDRENVTQYDEMLVRWRGEDGFIKRLNSTRLQSVSPGWLYEFVLDIRTAGWELGYLQAGRTSVGDADNQIEAQATSMFNRE